jgi:hypothetical protein
MNVYCQVERTNLVTEVAAVAKSNELLLLLVNGHFRACRSFWFSILFALLFRNIFYKLRSTVTKTEYPEVFGSLHHKCIS